MGRCYKLPQRPVVSTPCPKTAGFTLARAYDAGMSLHASPSSILSAPLDEAACYRAMQSHDARFDGMFFTAVTSTGIYCRPVCRVRAPRRENCRFFHHAAQAEAAGFRPCLRCRPELAPRLRMWSGEDASHVLAMQAAWLIDMPDAWGEGGIDVAQVAARLGVGDRHLRRVFQAHFGVTPMQYVQTRRLLTAKQLLADTALPVTQVAMASGFSSVRRFNAAFLSAYGLSPRALRARRTDVPSGEGIVLRLGWRPPFDVAELLRFFAARALAGVEAADVETSRVARTLRMPQAGSSGWVQARFQPEKSQVQVRVAPAFAGCLPAVIERVRGWFDLDADPGAIDAALCGDFPGTEGMRVPGTLDGFELAVHAILGQQVSVAAARTLLSRLVEAFGEPASTPFPDLTRCFPTPRALCDASEERFGALGIVRQRQRAIRALAGEVLAGRLNLQPGGDVPATLVALRAMPGIGDWTAQYIALRALRCPDAFPAGDIALRKALGAVTAHEAEARAQAWRPWRSYAVLRAWQGCFVSGEENR